VPAHQGSVQATAGGEELADGVEEVLEGYGFELVEEVPSTLWKAAGKLKGAWERVSLADCFALALTLEESGTLHPVDGLLPPLRGWDFRWL